MFRSLQTCMPNELATIIIWDYVDPIPRSVVLSNKKRLHIQFKNPILFAVHEELLTKYVENMTQSQLKSR